jgi:hypothetical protein
VKTVELDTVASVATPAGLMLAGEIFEKSRKAGATLEVAMREALRVLRAAVDAKAIPRRNGGPGQPGAFALALVVRIAGHHKVAPGLIRSRFGKQGSPAAAAREEAAGVLRMVGFSPDQIGAVLRCDRYVVLALAKRFDDRVRGDELLAQRAEQWASETRELAAREAEMRRPAQRATPATRTQPTPVRGGA